MKNKLIIRIFGAVLSATVLCGGSAAGEAPRAGGDKIKVPAEVTEIYVEAGDRVSVTFVKTAGTIAAAKVRSKSKRPNPVSIERQGTRMLVRIAGEEEASKPTAGGAYSGLELNIPSGRKVTVIGKNLVISGDLAVKNLEVKAISLSMHALRISASEGVSVETNRAELKFTLTGAKKLIVKADSVSGKITVPAATVVLCPEKEGFQIVRAGKSSGK